MGTKLFSPKNTYLHSHLMPHLQSAVRQSRANVERPFQMLHNISLKTSRRNCSVRASGISMEEMLNIGQLEDRTPLDLEGFMEKVSLCNRGSETKSKFLPFVVEKNIVGYIHPSIVEHLKQFGDVFTVHSLESQNAKFTNETHINRFVTLHHQLKSADERTEAVGLVIKWLNKAGIILGLRNELNPVVLTFGGELLFSLERAAVPYFGTKVAETRFASHRIVLRRLVRVKEALCQMVISNKWGGWKQVDTEKAKIVKDLIFSDDFWNRVEYALELTEPLMSMLWYADTDEPCLGNIYDAMDSMLERMKSVIQRREQDPDTLYSTVEKIVLHRWNKMTTPLHRLAYALSPRYYSSEILDIPGRVPPYRDPEVAAGYKRALNRLFSDPDVASNVRREFVDFVSGKFAEPDAINDQSRLDAIGWWYLHGERYMYLQPLAIKILSQAYGVHMNGYVNVRGEKRLWIGKRSEMKSTFPGMLDHLVAGGLPKGITCKENMIKECSEEAGIPRDVAEMAVPVGAVSYEDVYRNCFKRDVLFCYDLLLPHDFQPKNIDGEVERFMLVPVSQVANVIYKTKLFKPNCSLVIIDFLFRHGYINPDQPGYLHLLNNLRRGECL